MITNKNIDKKDVLKEYITYGGFPEILQIDESLKENYLDTLYDSIILRDIISRHDIRDVDILKKLLNFLIENTGQIFSAIQYQNTSRKKEEMFP